MRHGLWAQYCGSSWRDVGSERLDGSWEPWPAHAFPTTLCWFSLGLCFHILRTAGRGEHLPHPPCTVLGGEMGGHKEVAQGGPVKEHHARGQLSSQPSGAPAQDPFH